MIVEFITIRNTERAILWMPAGFVCKVYGSGNLLHGVDNMSRINLRAEPQTIGPFTSRVRVEVQATGDTTYALYDTNNLLAADLAALTTLLPGTRAWVIEETGRSERYWTGTAWEITALNIVGEGEPVDADGRPDGAVYFQVA
jgi:hypothetical protein